MNDVIRLEAIDLKERVPGCPNIRWCEVLYLTQWQIYVHPNHKQTIANLIFVCQKAQQIRAILGNEPLRFTSGLRPAIYNQLIRGAKNSAHVSGEALDFVHATKTADECRKILRPRLKELRLRMERHKGNWVHVDSRDPGPSGRYFQP